jgi:TPR repeat protein
MYYDGRGVTKDEPLAALWFRKAAEQGFVKAQFNLGLMYDNGRGVIKDGRQAYFWWLLASAQGDTDATKNRDVVEKRISAAQRADTQADARR